jgi:fumarate hydratase class II
VGSAIRALGIIKAAAAAANAELGTLDPEIAESLQSACAFSKFVLVDSHQLFRSVISLVPRA